MFCLVDRGGAAGWVTLRLILLRGEGKIRMCVQDLEAELSLL